MAPGHGCERSFVYIGKKTYERIKAGDDYDFDPHMEAGDICHDCNAGFGQYHHWGCDAEQCPLCHNQVIGDYCDCDMEIEEL